MTLWPTKTPNRTVNTHRRYFWKGENKKGRETSLGRALTPLQSLGMRLLWPSAAHGSIMAIAIPRIHATRAWPLKHSTSIQKKTKTKMIITWSNMPISHNNEHANGHMLQLLLSCMTSYEVHNIICVRHNWRAQVWAPSKSFKTSQARLPRRVIALGSGVKGPLWYPLWLIVPCGVRNNSAAFRRLEAH
jgi:hypothetical protein